MQPRKRPSPVQEAGFEVTVTKSIGYVSLSGGEVGPVEAALSIIGRDFDGGTDHGSYSFDFNEVRFQVEMSTMPLGQPDRFDR